MKGKFSWERYMGVTNILYTFKEATAFYGFSKKLSKKNKKYEICNKNFALWKNWNYIVDVKRQKQLPRDVLKFS